MVSITGLLDAAWKEGKPNWRSYWTLISVVVLISLCLIPSLVPFGGWQLYGIVAPIISLLFTSYWLTSTRLPKTKVGKLGFLIAIRSQDKELYSKVHEDFILTIKSLLLRGEAAKRFQFIELSPDQSKDITDLDAAQQLRSKTKSSFVLFGRVRKSGANRYLLELEGIVSHNPISKLLSDQVSKEFTELLPQVINIAPETDLLAFSITSSITVITAKYIIAITRFLSGDLDYAATSPRFE